MDHRSPPRPSAGSPALPLALPSLATAAVLALTVAACASGSRAPVAFSTAAPGATPVAAAPAPSAGDSGQTLRQPKEIPSVNGLLDVVLEATVRTLPVPTDSTPRMETLRTYRLLAANGVSYADSNVVGFPGPTFKVTQGDSVRILLKNHLPADTAPGSCMQYPASQQRGDTVPWDSMPNCFHGPNSTNIHFHGFHVSPQAPADDVLMQVAPGDSFQYAFRIPANQSAGTHWYHPHKHGSVAMQVTNGMSGAFVILARQGGLDSLTRARNIREVLVAVQEIDPSMNLIDNSIPRAKLVNGQFSPVIRMAPGEVIRMRLVNENIAATASYSLLFADKPGQEPSLYDIARDGVQYAPANYDTVNADTKLWVAPGNRLDAFVRAPCTTGTHDLQAEVARPQRDLPRKERVGAPLATVQTVLRVQVTPPAPGTTCTLTQLPPSLPPLPPFLGNLAGTTDTATMPVVVFSDTAPPFSVRNQGNPSRFWLGNAQNPFMRLSSSVFIPVSSHGVQQPMVVGQTQTWMVQNRGTSANHPFHIHINPFQVVSVAYGPGDPNAGYYAILNHAAQTNQAPIWLDVLPLPLPYVDSTGVTPVTRPGYAIVRQKYDTFVNADGTPCVGCGPPAGQFVMHCHILGHEERGMMQLLEIFPTLLDASRAGGTAQGAHSHH